MDPMLIAAGVQAAAGVAQTVTGAIQKAKAKRMAARNPRPKYYIPGAVMDNQRLTESKAGQGMSDSARNTFIQEQERGLTSSLEAVLKGGGSVNNIADLYGTYQSGVAKMSILDDEMRSQNIKNLIAQNNEMASYKDKEWQVNVFAPYADKAQAAAELAKQGSDNLWKGINTVGSAVSNYMTGKEYQNEQEKVFNEQKRVNDAYIDNMGRPTNVQQNTMTVYPIGPNGPQFDPNAQNIMGPYNWMKTADNTPTRPQPPTAYQLLQKKYPGLMYGGNFGTKMDY